MVQTINWHKANPQKGKNLIWTPFYIGEIQDESHYNIISLTISRLKNMHINETYKIL